MFAKIKLGAYIVLTILVIWFGWEFYVSYTAVSMSAVRDVESELADTSTTGRSVADVEPANNPDTSVTDTNAPGDTNTVADATPAADAASEADTNAVAADASNDATNTVTVSNAPVKAAAKTVAKKPAKKTEKAHLKQAKLVAKETMSQMRKTMITNLLLLVCATAGLGMLIAYDTTRLFAHRTVDALFDDDGPSGKDPEYEQAEQVWAEGRPIEAIELMRQYLKKNPREQYVALRIAEIYENDFKNYLAAALEYEEVLKHKLNPDRWGWAAIHLCNLYTKLGRQKESEALLRRIVTEYPKTSAAIKARKHLGLPEGAGLEAEPEPAAAEPAVAEPVKPAEPEEPSNLPPGFRKKK